MNTTTNGGKRQESRTLLRKFSYAINEAVWQCALVTVAAAALIDGVLTIGSGGGTIV